MELNEDFCSGRKKPWKEKKIYSLELAKIYKELSSEKREGDPLKERFRKRYDKILQCATFLEFRTDFEYRKKKLINANFCKIRLCPMCIWRRSLKIYSSTQKIMSYLKSDYKFDFITLTVRNVKGDYLRKTIEDLSKSFHRMIKCKEFKDNVKGYYKAIEVTVNKDYGSYWYGTYHPHIHLIIARNKNDKIMNIKEIKELWKRSSRLTYLPECDIREILEKKDKSIDDIVAEVSKYAVKDNDIILKSENLRNKNIEVLDLSLEGLRLVALGGCFKKVGRLLNIDTNIDTGDLTDIYREKNLDNLECIIRFVWNYGMMGYYSID